MASSNRHWPSMFKSKPCTTHHHQWQHDINSSSLVSPGCHRTPYAPGTGCEERSPEPKPRWNPKPEQIRILEAIFNSGMVNPPRDEIRKIRGQLQEYGQVGDANVFYWFQNRKSRSKHKLRLLQNSSKQPPQNYQTTPPITALTAPSPSSSSSSEKSSPKCSKRTLSLTSGQNVADMANSPTGSVKQTYFQQHNEFLPEPYFFPVHQPAQTGSYTQGFCFSDLSNVVQVQENNIIGPCTSLLLSEIMSSENSKKDLDHHHHHDNNKNMKLQSHLNYTVSTAPITHSIGLATDTNSVTVASINQVHQGLGESAGGAARSTVFINDVACEVGVGPFNVREAFGDDFILIQSSGHPVVTNEWGVTVHSLQHGASYYLVPFSISDHI